MDAVLNWLWQGTTVALALAGILRLLERCRATTRYAVCWVAMAFVLALPTLPLLIAPAASLAPVPVLSAPPVVSMPTAWWTSAAVALAVWAVWAAVLGARIVTAAVQVRRAMAASRPFPEDREASLVHWARLRRRGRPTRLVLSARVRAAAVLGVRTPVIAVSPLLLDSLDANELDRVVIHEWAHIQRRDDIVNLLQVLARWLAGWHPAVWWIDRRLHIEREVACDEMVVAVAGSPRSYAECLVKLAALPRVNRLIDAVPGVLASAGLRERITRVVTRHSFVAPLWSRGMAIAAVVVLCALSALAGRLSLVVTSSPAARMSAAMSEARPSVQTDPAQRQTLPASVPDVRANARAFAATRPPAAPVETIAGAGQTAPIEAGGAPSLRLPPPAPAILATAPPAPVVILEAAPLDLPGGVGPAVVTTVPPITTREPEEAAIAPPAHVVSLSASPAAPASTADSDRSAWVTAADAGTDIGRRSKTAGVATAGFFTRFARRVAGSF